MATMAERLAGNVPRQLVGRTAEVDAILRGLDADGPPVTYLHGLSGIGKSALLRAVATEAARHGVSVVALDGGDVEPTQRGFLVGLAEALGADEATPVAIGRALSALAPPALLLIDSFEALGLLDSWLRREFLPALGENVRVVLAGRLAPAAAWVEAPEWRGMVRLARLDGLDDGAADALLMGLGVAAADRTELVAAAHGHPLALILAASAGVSPRDRLPAVLHDLAQRFLADVADPRLRQAVQAAALVRRVTRPLLQAMLPGGAAGDDLARLAALPFVETVRDGLAIHEAVREAIAGDLQAVDPETELALRRAAWCHLQNAARGAPAAQLWRYTADLIYLVGNPVIRDAFFPRGAASYDIRPARRDDGAAIHAICAAHDGAEAAAVVAAWWQHCPAAFHVALAGGEVAGFYCLAQADDIPAAVTNHDPLTQRWRAHLHEAPLPRGQTALFLRRWLSRTDGERPSPVQAALWLDIKRHYLALRPRLRRVYLTVADPTPYAATAARLGMEMLPDPPLTLGGLTWHGVLLDMGPASVDGWLARLAGDELDVAEGGLLDIRARALRLGSRRVPLTRREFELLGFLIARAGASVSRDELLDELWGRAAEASSNVVDALVAGLRRKLGDRAAVLETVRGHGYRYREPGAGEERG